MARHHSRTASREWDGPEAAPPTSLPVDGLQSAPGRAPHRRRGGGDHRHGARGEIAHRTGVVPADEPARAVEAHAVAITEEHFVLSRGDPLRAIGLDPLRESVGKPGAQKAPVPTWVHPHCAVQTQPSPEIAMSNGLWKSAPLANRPWAPEGSTRTILPEPPAVLLAPESPTYSVPPGATATQDGFSSRSP